MNERAALYALLRHGAMSRVELDRAIGLSKPAAAELLHRLEGSGLVRRSGFRAGGGPGPQAQLWTANVAAGHAAGIDITAGSVEVAIADLGGEVVGEARQSTRGSGADPVRLVRETVQAAARSASLSIADVVHSVAGIQGSVDPRTGHLEYATHMPRWQGFDVGQRLGEALGGPVTAENDVNLVTVDEVAGGNGRGKRDVLLLWMSRGVAVAAMVEGRLVRGARGGAGEIDRTPIAGRDGLLIRELLSNRGVLALAHDHDIPGAGVTTAVRRGMGQHPDFAAELTGRIALTLVGLVGLLDPELVLLAGDVAMAGGQPLAEAVAERLHAMVAHRPEVAVAAGSAHSVRQGALHAAVGAAREAVFGRGFSNGVSGDLESWLLPIPADPASGSAAAGG